VLFSHENDLETGYSEYVYNFYNKNNERYVVNINRSTRQAGNKNVYYWNISFKTRDDYKVITNIGDMYNIMATVLEIVRDFIRRENPDYMTFAPSKNNPDDYRRFNLYNAYIKKNLPFEYEAYPLHGNEEIFIQKKGLKKIKDNGKRNVFKE
jgi:hypothetical protein